MATSATPPRYLLLLACSARKDPRPTPLPAHERYTGVAFAVLRKALAQYPDLVAHLDLVILSAEFGILLDANTPLPPYNRKMTLARAHELASTVGPAFDAYLQATPYTAIFANLGYVYLAALRTSTYWSRLVATGQVQLAAGGIGHRLAQQKAWLGRLAATIPSPIGVCRACSRTQPSGERKPSN